MNNTLTWDKPRPSLLPASLAGALLIVSCFTVAEFSQGNEALLTLTPDLPGADTIPVPDDIALDWLFLHSRGIV